jgi:cysteine-rich repeat protein
MERIGELQDSDASPPQLADNRPQSALPGRGTRIAIAARDTMESAMNNCPRCEGFVPPTTHTCPNCDTTLSQRLLRKAAKAAVGAATAMTLMACYGGGWDQGYQPTDEVICNDGQSGIDNDRDGYCSDVDCNDNDGSVSFDCNPQGCVDNDLDGWCQGEDCNDNNADIGADCDCVDIDGDGYCSTEDCDDQDATIWQECPDICSAVVSTVTPDAPVEGTKLVGSDVTSTCGEGDTEMIYEIVIEGDPGVLQWVTVDVTSESTHFLAVRDDCQSVNDIACAIQNPHVEVLAAPDDRFYLIVEAASEADRGDFSLSVDVQPLVCGDGILVGPEACDDGNQDAGDGCDALCQLEGPK